MAAMKNTNLPLSEVRKLASTALALRLLPKKHAKDLRLGSSEVKIDCPDAEGRRASVQHYGRLCELPRPIHLCSKAQRWDRVSSQTKHNAEIVPLKLDQVNACVGNVLPLLPLSPSNIERTY